MPALSAIVLAAGLGTRMKSARPKAVHTVCGRPLVGWTLAALAEGPRPGMTVVVVGTGADDVRAAVASASSALRTALQERLAGTGDAAMVGMEALGDRNGDVLVLSCDSPLLTAATLDALLAEHRRRDAAVTLLTAMAPDPTGYGRVLRRSDRLVEAVVEHRDATPEQRAIAEVNTSMYVFDADALRQALPKIRPDNDQGEYYLTDAVGILHDAGRTVAAYTAPFEEVQGVNSRDQLATAEAAMRARINAAHMEAGVTFTDPLRTYVDVDVEIGSDTVVHPGTYLRAGVRIGSGCEIGPDVHLAGTVVGDGVTLWYAVIRGARIEAGADVGPYVSLRPGTVLREGAHAGTFVEMKNSDIGARTKVPHLSYVGDATVGEDSNFGAGTITCNWDGVAKHRTVVGDRVLIASDTMLVAPVTVGSDAATGAAAVIRNDIPEGTLAVTRAETRHLPDQKERLRKRRLAAGKEVAEAD